MSDRTTIRRLEQRVAALEADLKAAREMSQTIAAQRERETKRAKRVEVLLDDAIGGLLVFLRGIQSHLDEANDATYKATCDEFLTRKSSG